MSTPQYAHHTPFLHAVDVHPIDHLGPPEDRVVHAFVDAYSHARKQCRSPEFARALKGHWVSAHSAMSVVDDYLTDAQMTFHAHLLPTFERVCHGGAADARIAFHAVAKAEPARRRRIVPMPRRARGPRLTGLRPSPVPPPHGTYPADPHHVIAARQLAGNLVTHVTRSQRSQIRDLITESITRGIPVDATASRVANVVGLFPRWQRAVLNLHNRMLDNGVPKRIAARRAQDYADELLDKRAQMIARTELLRAMNTGRLAGWHDLADQGQLDPQKSIKQWSATIDDRTCPECEYLGDPSGDGKGGLQVVGIDSMFDTEYGPMAVPPAHPHCRCTVILKPVIPADSPALVDLPAQLAADLQSAADPDLLQLRSALA